MRISMQDTSRSIPASRGGLAGWILDRYVFLRSRGRAETRELRVLETLSLGGKRQLMLVACGAQRYLVGVGTDSVEAIVSIAGESLDPALRFTGTTHE